MRKTGSHTATLTTVVLILGAVQPAFADPCGMVPPIYPGQEIPLARVGLQQTYVYYNDGIETFVIRPGFTGKVEQFGMLIPFPTPPAIRKVPDHIFQHLAAAVDPPEVLVDLRTRFSEFSRAKNKKTRDLSEESRGLRLERDEVKVLKEEAVGMYEVAVLAAGSAKALKRWIDDHGYTYPDGMDEACNDYVDAGWCFVAVKTKVGEKKAVDPKPGQRTVDTKLPKGSTFDGHVQGMGFRFKVDELVVPMRLSAFNKGELRNIVYLLTDGPRKIRMIPEEYVVRQVTGKQLFKNLTELLPLRIIGGTEADIPEYTRKTLPQQRDPVAKNGAAAELFASDMLASKTGELALAHEEREKELLRIGERFGLRGPDVDKLNIASLENDRRKTVEKSLSQVEGMTLTVVDGDFPRELIRGQNLKFARYQMPSRRNHARSYDAKLNGPAPKLDGIIRLGALAPVAEESIANRASAPMRTTMIWLSTILAAGIVGLVLSFRRKNRSRTAVGLVLLLTLLASRVALSAESYYEKTLTEKKIEADTDGLNEYLRSLHPSKEQRERAKMLIVQLGTTDSFSKREEAMAKLLILPVLPNEALIAAMNGSDAEIRWRAKTILDLGKPESDRVLYAAFKTIEEKKIDGVTTELLRAIPLCDKPHLQYAASEALKAAAKPSDAATLRESIKSENTQVRIAATGAIGQALAEKAAKDLYALSDDPESQVQMAAALALANIGDRRSLTELTKLLSSDARPIRVSSALALRELTGQRFGFTPYEDVDKRKAAIKKWGDWIAGDGKTAKLSFPLRPYGSGVSYLHGNTLLAFGGGNKVAEYDASGEEVWTYTKAQNVWSAEKLSNGNVLIAAYGNQNVTEIDAKGNTVWQYDLPSLNAKQLYNGNFLIADWNGNRALEVDRDKNIVWQYKTQTYCGDLHRLDNGNTLLTEYQGSVKEVTPDGKVVWQHPATNCYGCQPLPNGNVIITEIGGRVFEVTRDKKVVWEFKEQGAVDAFRLPNGNTLITGSSRFVEVSPDKTIIWSKTGCSYGTARR